MFAINFNFPYRKKDGSLITMEKALDGAGADLDLIDLDDVAIIDPAEGDGLIYDNTAQKWKNIPIISRILTLFNAWKKNGAYNLCPVLNTTQVINGVTWTVNSDGTVTANCSSNSHAKSIFWIWADSTLRLSFPYTVRVCGAPSGAASNTYHVGGAGIPGGELYTETNITANTNIGLALVVVENAVVDNIVFKPMITKDLNATYADYVPYAKTNRELTEDGGAVKELPITLETGISYHTDSKSNYMVSGVKSIKSVVKGITANASTWVTIGVVDSAYTPKAHSSGTARRNGTTDILDCNIYSSGHIVVRDNSNAIGSADLIILDITYI